MACVINVLTILVAMCHKSQCLFVCVLYCFTLASNGAGIAQPHALSFAYNGLKGRSVMYVCVFLSVCACVVLCVCACLCVCMCMCLLVLPQNLTAAMQACISSTYAATITTYIHSALF